MMADVVLALEPSTPAPLRKHLQDALGAIGLSVTCMGGELSHAVLFLLAAPPQLLEAQAEVLSLPIELLPQAKRSWSEEAWAVRDFCVANRAAHAAEGADVPFTPAQRAHLTLAWLDGRLMCDTAGEWTAALVASGRADAVEPKREWLVGPHDTWAGQPLLGALEALGYLRAASPTHGPGHRSSVGLPLGLSQIKPWCARVLLRGEVVTLDAIRDYWGEGVAFYFAWQQYYLRLLTLPAGCGLLVYLARPATMSIDDDPNVPLFSLLAVVWAILFVTSWRGKQSGHAFAWGTADTHRAEQLRPEFEGVPITDPISGQPMLHDQSRALRWAASLGATVASLVVPLAAMIISLNLQGYIVASTGPWLGLSVHVPALAKHAAPGALFDPLSGSTVLPLVPVALHAITIQVLNALFRRVASYLTHLENHRTARAHERSMLWKRFVFEACDCYLALFYIAFELRDVPKLRTELIALFTADTVRRVLLETIVPLALNWRAVRTASPDGPADGAAVGGLAAGQLKPRSPKRQLFKDDETELRHRLAEIELEPYEDFDDYLEMVIQFGYITLFASAFPLAPAVCLLCNGVELVADGFKLAFLSRKPRPSRAASIGGWSACCYALMAASIYTNLFLIGVASDQMAAIFPSMFEPPPAAASGSMRSLFVRSTKLPSTDLEMRDGMGRYVVLMMAGMEHVLLLLLVACEMLLTAAPGWVRLAIARREYEAREPRAMHPLRVGEAA